MRNCVILPLCAEGCLAGPPSFLWDQSDHHRSVTFFIQITQRITFRIGGFIHCLNSFKVRLFFCGLDKPFLISIRSSVDFY